MLDEKDLNGENPELEDDKIKEDIVSDLDNQSTYPEYNSLTEDNDEMMHQSNQNPPIFDVGSDDFFNNEKQQTYEWDYEKYSKMDKFSKTKTDKSKGFFVLSTILASIFGLSLIVFGGIKISDWLRSLNIASNSQYNNIASQVVEDEEIVPKNKNSSDSLMFTSNISPAIAIAEKVTPSIVSIITYEQVSSGFSSHKVESGGGSGVIIKPNGVIVTNAHVLFDERTRTIRLIKVMLSNGREYEGRVMGVDLPSDLGVVKIEASDLPAIEMGDATFLRAGEQVYIIGSPGGAEYAGSIADGIVSALKRSPPQIKDSIFGNENQYIQTTVPINNGNSGGGMVDVAGKLVGIPNSKLSGAELIGFAIPMDAETKRIIEDLEKYGRVPGRAQLGIAIIAEIDEFTARANGGIKTGIWMQPDPERNPAWENKGIKDGILHSMNGVKLESAQKLRAELKKSKPKDIANLVLYRYENNQEQEIKVSIPLVEDTGIDVNAKAPSVSENRRQFVDPQSQRIENILRQFGLIP